jgi:hypothetical protein
MDKGHSTKALSICPELSGGPFNCKFYDITLLYGEGESIPSPSMHSIKGEIPCR